VVTQRRLAIGLGAAAAVAVLLAVGYVAVRPSAGSVSWRPPEGLASGSAEPQASDPASATAVPGRSASGRPGRGNTGVPAGKRLTAVTGDKVYATPNQVVDGLDIRGYVRITAKNVTIKNSIVRGGAKRCNAAVIAIAAGASATIQDVEVNPGQPNACLDGIWATSALIVRVNVHGTVDGLKAFDNVTLQDSWVHDLSYFASDPNQNGGPTHNDTVQTYEGNRHIVLRHNTLNPGAHGNAAYQVTQDGGQPSTDLHVEGNFLDGGGCTLNFAHKGGPAPMTGIYVVDNRFGRNSAFKCPILLSTQTTLTQNSGNVWDDTGQPIPAPQRHD
jgi:hypothetical protein